PLKKRRNGSEDEDEMEPQQSSSCHSLRHLLGLRSDNFFEYAFQAARDRPVRIMGLELSQVRDVADMVSLASLVDIAPIHFASGHLLNSRNCLQHGSAVSPSAAHVVHLARAGIDGKFLDGANHIVTVYVVPNLLALIAKHRVGITTQRHLHQIGKKA